MQIVMFSDSYLPRISGVVHSIVALVGALRARGHRVVVAAPAYPAYVESDPDVVRFPSLPAPRQRDFPLAVPVAPGAWRALDAHPFDVAHTHTPFLMGAAAWRLARRRGIPLVFTHHTLYDEYVHYVPVLGPGVTRPAVRRYTTAFANRCDCVVAPSRAVADRLRAFGVRVRIEVVPTGSVDLQTVAALDPSWVRPVFGIPADLPLLVTMSRLAKEKSIDLVLRAAAVIAGRRPVRLLVVGGGPEEHALRRLAVELGLDEVVIFAGPQPYRKALECLAAGDVFIFASQTETQGLVVIEAMACGLPVVAVRAGGIADAVTDGTTGVLTGPSAEALAAAALTFLDDPARRRTVGEAGRAAAARFAPQAVTAQLEAVYRSLTPVRR